MSPADKTKSLLTLLLSTVLVGILFYITFFMMPGFLQIEASSPERFISHNLMSRQSLRV